jgi:hypothetical protein
MYFPKNCKEFFVAHLQKARNISRPGQLAHKGGKPDKQQLRPSNFRINPAQWL